jgi:hypothetical protein
LPPISPDEGKARECGGGEQGDAWDAAVTGSTVRRFVHTSQSSCPAAAPLLVVSVLIAPIPSPLPLSKPCYGGGVFSPSRAVQLDAQDEELATLRILCATLEQRALSAEDAAADDDAILIGGLESNASDNGEEEPAASTFAPASSAPLQQDQPPTPTTLPLVGVSVLQRVKLEMSPGSHALMAQSVESLPSRPNHIVRWAKAAHPAVRSAAGMSVAKAPDTFGCGWCKQPVNLARHIAFTFVGVAETEPFPAVGVVSFRLELRHASLFCGAPMLKVVPGTTSSAG